MLTFQNFFLSLTGNLSERDIGYCVLRNHRGLPHVNTGNDIDFLVSPFEPKELESALAEIEGVSVIGRVRRENVISFFIYGVMRSNGSSTLQIDFASKASYKGIEYLSTDSVLSSSVGSLVRAPTELHEAVVSFFSSYLVGGWIKERYQDFVVKTADSNSQGMQSLLTPTLGHARSYELVEALARDRRADLLKMLPKVRRALLLRALSRDIFGTIWKILSHYFYELRIRLWERPRTDIVVLGPDGAGKSTVIDRLLNSMESAAKVVIKVHLKHWRFKREAPDIAATTTPHASAPRCALLSTIKLILWVTEHIIGVLSSLPRNSQLVIWDRNYHDILADPLRYRDSTPKWLVKLIGKAIPKPDMWLILDAPPEVVRSRKMEVSPEESERQFYAYKELARELPNAFLVDATLSPDEVALACEQRIVTCMTEKHRLHR